MFFPASMGYCYAKHSIFADAEKQRCTMLLVIQLRDIIDVASTHFESRWDRKLNSSETSGHVYNFVWTGIPDGTKCLYVSLKYN